MADNVAITPGTGTTVATDDVGGVQYQKIKLFSAGDGSTNPVLSDSSGALLNNLATPEQDAAGLPPSGVEPYGRLRVSMEPSEMFTDTFDGGTLDTTIRWTTAGTAMTQTTGVLNAAVGGVTTSARASLSSKMTFTPNGNAPTILWALVKFETGGVPTTNTHRWIGFGTEGSAPTATGTTPGTNTPVQDGVGLEITTDQNVRFSIYNTGVRAAGSVALSTAAKTLLFDGNWHRIFIVKRGDWKYLFIDDSLVPVASVNMAFTGSQALPVLIHTINNSVAPAATPAFQVAILAIGDQGRNNIQISDPTYPWRQAAVAGGSQSLSVLPGPNNGSRTNVSITVNRAAGVATEGLLSLIKTTNSVAAAGATSIGVASGKILRLTSWSVTVRNSTAVFQGLEINLRSNPSGATVVTSPILASFGCNAQNATLGSVGNASGTFADGGMEFSGAMTLGLGQIATTTAAQVTVTLHGYEYSAT